MERTIRGNSPIIEESAVVSDQAYLIGNVEIKDEASVWPFVCIRGDTGPVEIGRRTNVQEFSMIHGSSIGDNVTVGHNVVIDFAEVKSNSLIGITSVILDDATVESNCLVAAGSVVMSGQTIPEGHLAYGTPAQTKELTDEQRAMIERITDHYVELGQEFAAEDGI
ncbi:gamma carbonic anhydrase family protein [Natronorarus salvus]|uniref:gamma carbonic anhydrase family protein n=1 Tax=Natronorarus salvus TaxID=3117733 RepID=UPI002F26C31E